MDELRQAHAQLSTGTRGRQWTTEQIVWALVVRLSAEFQGYCGEVLALAVNAIAGEAADARVQSTISLGMQTSLRLGSGNPNPDNLRSDFRRVGLDLWGELTQRTPRGRVRAPELARWSASMRSGVPATRADLWKLDLEQLGKARNGIAHSDELAIGKVRAEGYPLRMTSIVEWRRSLNGLVAEMDDLVSDHLASLLSTTKPW